MVKKIELTQDQWSEWKESPVTEIFLKYLKDSAKEEAELITSTVVEGGILTESEQVRSSSICVTLNRIAEIDLDEVIDFYTIEE